MVNKCVLLVERKISQTNARALILMSVVHEPRIWQITITFIVKINRVILYQPL